jgi:hypothetical protein
MKLSAKGDKKHDGGRFNMVINPMAPATRKNIFCTLAATLAALTGAVAISKPLQAQTPSAHSYAAVSGQASVLLAKGLRDLSSERYAVRQKATRIIQTALGLQLQAMINAGGPEQATRLIKLLDFNINLDRWTMAVIKLPRKKRMAMFDWGIQPAVLPLVGAAFARRADVRATAATGLAKLSGPNSNWILDRLLGDPRRVVYLTAMAALWDHKPSARMVQIVFRRAVGNMTMYSGATTRQLVQFNGQKIYIMHFVNYWQQAQDGQYAAQLLEHWHPVQLKAMLMNFTEKLARNTGANDILQNPSMLQGRNFIHLFTQYKPLLAAPYLLNLISRPQTNQINFMFNNQSVHWDNRTIPLYLLVLLSGHKPQHYHFFKSALYGGSWLFNTQVQEETTIKAMLKFWKQRGVVPIPPIEPGAKPPAQAPVPGPGLAVPATSITAIPAGPVIIKHLPAKGVAKPLTKPPA